MTNISCIIPTYKRPRTLLQALKSLQNQTLSTFEILIIDNNADSKIKQMIDDFNATARIPGYYIPEPRLGLHNCRHSGASAAKGDVLVFTDDDATFDSSWLYEYTRYFDKYPEMMAAGGPVRPVWEEPPTKWLQEYMKVNKTIEGYLSLLELGSDFCLNPQCIFFGVNMAIRHKVLFEVGGFNPDSFGDIWLGDGECGLNSKLWDKGMLIGYVPTAIVHHHIPPQRMTVEYLYLRTSNQAASDMYAKYHGCIPHRIHLMKHAVKIIIKNKFWIKSLFYRGRTYPYALNMQLNAVKTKSYVKYIFRLIFSKNFRALVLKKKWLNSYN